MNSEELKQIIESNADHISFEDMLKDRIEGLVLEFGVATGSTINEIADHCDKVYGFDSFDGLPEDWRPEFKKGYFKCDLPEISDNVELIVGMIQDTIDDFLIKHPEPVSFIHIDVDLYSSTACVLQKLKDRICSGTIIAFDELYVYPNYQEHEFKAFLEFINDTGFEVENIGCRHGEARTFRIK
jgi:hypothetical protein